LIVYSIPIFPPSWPSACPPERTHSLTRYNSSEDGPDSYTPQPLVLATIAEPTCHRSALCVVVGPSSSSLGCHLAHIRRHWWAHSSSLGRSQGLLIVVGTSPGPTRFHWVLLLLGCPTNLGVEHMWSEARKEEKNDHDVLSGPPIAWVTPHVHPSLTPPSSFVEPPTSLWRGEGQMWL
jgi:hypothetical protein